MSNYTEFIARTASKKIVLFEIDRGEMLGDNLWEKHSPGVWKTTYAWTTGKNVSTTAYGVGTWGAGNWGKTSATTLPTSPRDKIQIVGSLEINTVDYLLVDSVELVETTDESFYWDTNNQIIYVNYDGYIRDTSNVINLGITFGYSTNALYFNNIFYDGRIKSIPEILVKRDNLFNSVVRFEGGTVTLNNTDGEFDHFGDRDVYGKKVKIKFGGDDLLYSDYETIYTGYVEKYDLAGQDIVISVKDERKNLQRKIPNTYYTSSAYYNIEDGNVGAGIGLGYGIVNRATAICLNEKLTTSTYNFKFVDTTRHDIESIDQVYVNGIAATHTNESLTGGTFNLSNTVYEPGQLVSVSFHGYTDGVDLISNPLDIIEDLLEIYTGALYTSDFYNTTEWDEVKAIVDDIALFVDKGKTLISVIGEISSSILATFMVEGDGRFTMKVVDLTKTPLKTIIASELMNQPIQNNKSDEYLSSVRIGYNKANTTDKHSYYNNTTDESALFTKYRSYVEKDFKTLLTVSSDAEDYSDVIMTLFGGIIPEYNITTKMQNIDVELEDIVDVELYIFNDGSFGIVRCEVISKSVNYSNNTITFIIKWISDVTADLKLAKLIKWK